MICAGSMPYSAARLRATRRRSRVTVPVDRSVSPATAFSIAVITRSSTARPAPRISRPSTRPSSPPPW
jgi:hypothetical protein